jgi:hypothetical protein
MVSSVLSRVSALTLLIAGVTLLFAPDVVLPAVVSGFPTAAAWLGQLLAGAWLGVAALNWLQRTTALGGIYGRPTVVANLALYFISTLSLLRALLNHAASPMLWFAVASGGVLAAAYFALLLHGPFGVSERPAS